MLLLAANHPTIKFGTLKPAASLMLDNLDEFKKRLNLAATLQATGRESSIYTSFSTVDHQTEPLACAPTRKPGSLIVKGPVFRLFGASPYIERTHHWQNTPLTKGRKCKLAQAIRDIPSSVINYNDTTTGSSETCYAG